MSLSEQRLLVRGKPPLIPLILRNLRDRCVAGYIGRMLRNCCNRRVQIVDIYYKGVGMMRGFSPEELEEIFQESESPARQERRVG